MSVPTHLELTCPAKVNLTLSVGLPAEPGELHPLASWMVALGFGDHLRLQRLAQGPSRYSIAYAPDAPCPGKVDWPLEKDLGWRAHRLLEQQAGEPLPVDLRLTKRIPTGAGLGGGSSDAAGVLVGINQLMALNLGRQTLVRLAQQLGSDVGFLVAAMLGEPSALVRGFGEQIEPLPMAGPLCLVLAFPPFGCPTGPVYQAFDQLASPGKQADAQAAAKLARQCPLDAASLFNDLAEPACRVQPPLADWLLRMSDAIGRPTHVTGSGSTLFALAADQVQAQQMVQQVRTLGLPCVATWTR